MVTPVLDKAGERQRWRPLCWAGERDGDPCVGQVREMETPVLDR